MFLKNPPMPNTIVKIMIYTTCIVAKTITLLLHRCTGVIAPEQTTGAFEPKISTLGRDLLNKLQPRMRMLIQLLLKHNIAHLLLCKAYHNINHCEQYFY